MNKYEAVGNLIEIYKKIDKLYDDTAQLFGCYPDNIGKINSEVSRFIFRYVDMPEESEDFAYDAYGDILYDFSSGELTKHETVKMLINWKNPEEYIDDNGNPMCKCKFCGEYFSPRKANANFCPPPEANGRSKCASRYDAMVRRIILWHYHENLSVSDIKDKIKKPMDYEDIQNIINEYNGALRRNKND